jgi:glutamate dehydrogenase/leucine dehydrogenase
VAGAANNQLVDDTCAAALQDIGVLYVPDFVANPAAAIQLGRERTAR